MKGLKFLALIIVCVFAMAATASAQALAGKKVATMDLSKIFDNYQKTKEFDKVLEESFAGYQKELKAKADKLTEAENKLALLKDAERAKMQKEVEQQRTEAIAFDQAKRTDLTKQRDEKIREILLEIEKVVSDYAKKEGYDLILNDRVLVYGNPNLDITEPVLKLLNDTYNKK